ncbi:MAG: AraC family transcriptional regulator [Thalassobius sp.]|nr:AraC family transcriptional regulator [Thalassovita sp.]
MSTTSHYFAISEKDQQWGLHVLDCGTSRIHAGEAFPSKKHPEVYQFNWERGRILYEFQIIYLIEGSGVFESQPSGTIQLAQGDMMFIFPNVWHRYKPDKQANWHTYWVGFGGDFTSKLIENLNITKESPIKQIGYSDKIIKVFMDILETSQFEFTGYQQVLAGEITKLIGWIHAEQRRAEFKKDNVDKIIQTAKTLLMQNNFSGNPERVAAELNMSYSKFRKLFKDYTGLAPGQFQMRHKIATACNMLNEGKNSIKEISDKLGFETPQYFTRIFKKKMGKSPGAYKKQFRLL